MQSDATFAERYLRHYGYLADSPLALTEREQQAQHAEALRAFQERAGLPQTGEMNSATAEMMARPRCGCKDIQRLEAQLAKWRKNRLTYFIKSRVAGLTREQFDGTIRAAFDAWEAVCNVKFAEVASAALADLIIDTGRGAGDNFDGPSGVLAWAFLPRPDGGQLIMKFDLGENWVVTGNGILILNVACHEFGHMLGLDHSRVSSALMAPIYSAGIAKPQQNDDVPRIQSLFGKPAAAPGPGPAPTPAPVPIPSPCQLLLNLNKAWNAARHTLRGERTPTMDQKVIDDFRGRATEPCANLFAALDKLCPRSSAYAQAAINACSLVTLLLELVPKLCPPQQKA